VVELEGGGRILLSETVHVAWVAQLLVTIPGSLAGIPDRSATAGKIDLSLAAQSHYHCV